MFMRTIIGQIITMGLLFYISWKLTIITVGGVLFIALFVTYYGKKVRDLSKIQQDRKGELGSISEEAIQHIRTVKAFSSEHQETKKHSIKNQEAYEVGKKTALYNAFFSFIIAFSMNGCMAGIIYGGAILYRDGEISIGNISAFLLYMIQLLINFSILGVVFGNVYKMLGASDKIIAIMKHLPIVNSRGGSIIPDDKVTGEIELKNVTFRYPTKADVTVSDDVCLTVKQNQVVALVGQSGCGKTSLVNLILRMYDPIEGQIMFSGHDIKDLDPKWYKKQIALVAQEPVLFSTTIRENICYGLDNSTVTEADMDLACKQSNCYDFIHDMTMFPDGYDTLVGEKGVKLSGGQKQRVAIARALIRKPKVLLLDEATSALDAESEHLVQQALDGLIKSGEQTIIVIAHRFSTIRDADKIVVMKAGKIEEVGNHGELMEKAGAYKKLISR